jgi:hypothetical protein
MWEGRCSKPVVSMRGVHARYASARAAVNLDYRGGSGKDGDVRVDCVGRTTAQRVLVRVGDEMVLTRPHVRARREAGRGHCRTFLPPDGPEKCALAEAIQTSR